MPFQAAYELLKQTASEWSEDNAPRLGASLAYYTVFSIAPVLIIAIAIAGLFFGQEAAQGEVVRQMQGLIGREGGQAVQTMIQNASQPSAGITATIIGIVTLLFGASGVFGELQSALNTIWNVQPKPDRGIMGIIKDRFFSFTLVLGTGFLLLVSLIISSILSALGTYMQSFLPGYETIWQSINFVISFGVTTLLFAMIYKFIPDAEIDWSDVWTGAAFTALLFSIGRLLIGIYLGNSSTTSVYGAAGSLVIVLIWVYYSAQILFFGAEFTQVYANRYGSRMVPAPNAMQVDGSTQSGAQLRERQVGAPLAAESEAAPQAPTASRQVGTLTGLIVGWLIGRRRSRDS